MTMRKSTEGMFNKNDKTKLHLRRKDIGSD